MKIIFILFFCTNIISGFAQSQEVPAFVKKVYNDLYNTLSITKEISKPILQYFPDDKEMIIDYIPASGGLDGKIRVGAEFLAVIRSFGTDSSNALAFVLGHEMAHIFLEQSNIDRVGSGYADKELRKKLKDVKDSIYTTIFERQADEQAMFNAHLGGYKTTHIADSVLIKIYEHFKLKDHLKGYPTLKERAFIAHVSALKMAALLERFEIANLALIKGHYELSSKIYEAIINEGFKSSEIYNNLGLSYLLKVIESDTLFQKYEWPIFLDSKTKLSSGEQRGTFFDVSSNLNLAIKYFEIANRSTEYKWSFLNLSIAHLVYDLSKEEINNDHLADSKTSLSKIKVLNLPQYITMTGIISHYEGDLEKAKSSFISNAETCALSKRNLDKLFFNIQPISIDQNPLNKIMSNNQNLFEVFYDKKIAIISDTSTKLLNSFMNTSLVKKMGAGVKYIKFENKSIAAKIFIAEFSNQFEALTEMQLSSFADQIYQSNLYTYYVYQDWIIRYDSLKSRRVYLIQYTI